MSTVTGPTTKDVIKRIGTTNDLALAYVRDPDPALSRLPRKVREDLIADLPAVTAAALLGPDALARHLVASAASGRYRDLFTLWDLFRSDPESCRPVLADRPEALGKSQEAMRTAIRLGLAGHADRVAEDVGSAQGLIWQWLREILEDFMEQVGQRPAVAAALLAREPDAAVPLPAEPDVRWLTEAADAATEGPLPPPIEERLAAGMTRLPATIGTLQLAHERYPEHVPALLNQVDLESPQVEAMLAWARDHDAGAALVARIREEVEEAATRDRADGLARWRGWRDRGVALELPSAARTAELDGLDPTRPETADLIAALLDDGASLAPQSILEELAGENRQRAEKAYEAFVCADLAVTLPPALEGNPVVKDGTRCPACFAWTWVRPGHEERCPRLRRAASELAAAAPPAPPTPPAPPSVADAWDAAAAQEDADPAAETPADGPVTGAAAGTPAGGPVTGAAAEPPADDPANPDGPAGPA